jgi:hypothetical protein
LPESIPWPRADDGYYLTFLTQLDLREMPSIVKNPLPRNGILYFFIESDDWATDVRARLLFYPGRRTLLQKAPDPREEELAWPSREFIANTQKASDWFGLDLSVSRQLVPHKITITGGIDIPSYGSELFSHVSDTIEPNRGRDAGYRMLDLARDAHGLRNRQTKVGQLLGSAQRGDGDERINAHLTSIGKNGRIDDYAYRKRNKRKLQSCADDWRFIWQIESESDVGVCIHDAGDLNIFIRNFDLAKRDFSKAYFEVDSS